MSYLENDERYLEYLEKADGIRPGFLNLELTSRCNLRCVMCPKTVGFHTHKPDNEIPDAVLEKIIDQVLPSVYHINLIGFGEPLLVRKKLEILLKECAHRHISINMITNGQLLSREVAEKLVEMKLFNINVSLDAATEETYRKIRNSDFINVKNNLKTLKEIKAKRDSQLPTLDLSFVGMIDNIKEFSDFILLAHDLGARKVVLQALSEVPESLVHEKDIFIHNREIGLENYKKAEKIANELGMKIELFPPDQFEIAREDTQQDHKIPEKNGIKMIKDCAEPWNAVFISSEGGVSPCCGLPSMGNLADKNFDEIWFGKEITGLRRYLRTEDISQACIYCRGSGWRQPTEVQEEIFVGRDDNQFGMDWYPIDHEEGIPVRWSRQTGTYFIKSSTKYSFVEIESIVQSAILKVLLNDEPFFSSAMTGGFKHDRFIIEPTHNKTPETGSDIIKIALITNKTAKPAEKGGTDGRLLGVKFFSHSELKTAQFRGNWNVAVSLSRVFNGLRKKDGWLSINATLTQSNSIKNDIQPFLFIHMIRTNPLFKLIRLIAPDGLLRIIKQLFSGSYSIPVQSEIKTGIKLEQVQLRWNEKISSGKYEVYAGLWHPQTGKRLKLIDPYGERVSKNRIFLGSVEVA